MTVRRHPQVRRACRTGWDREAHFDRTPADVLHPVLDEVTSASTPLLPEDVAEGQPAARKHGSLVQFKEPQELLVRLVERSAAAIVAVLAHRRRPLECVCFGPARLFWSTPEAAMDDGCFAADEGMVVNVLRGLRLTPTSARRQSRRRAVCGHCQEVPAGCAGAFSESGSGATAYSPL